MATTMSPPTVIPSPIQATFGSEAWWATHLSAVLAFAVGLITIVHPAWLHITSTVQAFVAPVAFVLSVLSIFGYLVFALLHHKISRQTFVADVEADLPGLKQAITAFSPLLSQIPALKTSIEAVSTDITAVKAQLAAQPAAADVGNLVRAELAKLGWNVPAPPAG